MTVPVYETSSAEQLAWILEDSGAIVAIVEKFAPEGRLATGKRRN